MNNNTFVGTDVFKNYFKNNDGGDKFISRTIINPQQLTIDYTGASALGEQKNIDIEGFTDRLKYLLTEAWGDTWGEFSMESPTGTDPDNTKLPIIVFDVVERIPSKGKTGLKPRQTELFIDPENPDYTLILNRKWFDCVVEFMFFETTNRDARKLMNRFETFIEAYVGFFKEEGISEMIFRGEIDSRSSKNFKATIPSVCLRYFMVIERILVERVRTTKEIQSKIQSKQSNSQQE